ncbi:IclR family transcriptional regulator [Escherichia coli]|uniref:IclR family transcriptional regulator n=1 Tax=Escherichia coli TaxID=562 RepID=A0A376TQ47_ECOLX|nr:IclR family transcriptional regulator [Escherichia coli]
MHWGLRCLAACIFDEHREPFAAISISGPISRITDDRVTEFGAMVIKAAKEVTLGVRWNALTFSGGQRQYSAHHT